MHVMVQYVNSITHALLSTVHAECIELHVRVPDRAEGRIAALAKVHDNARYLCCCYAHYGLLPLGEVAAVYCLLVLPAWGGCCC